MKMEQTVCSETLAFKLQMPGNHPEESIRQITNDPQRTCHKNIESSSEIFSKVLYRAEYWIRVPLNDTCASEPFEGWVALGTSVSSGSIQGGQFLNIAFCILFLVYTATL
jgi:hypothetical protein